MTLLSAMISPESPRAIGRVPSIIGLMTVGIGLVGIFAGLVTRLVDVVAVVVVGF
ncbi:MAG: hypothetical protein ACFFEX_12300 [Candidatus Thorarchaeota archaeon]